MLSERISSWPVCSGYASVSDAYAQHFLKGMRSVHALVPDAYAQCTHQFLTRMLSVRISSWRACSVHASIPYAHAEVYKMNIWKIRKLVRMLSMRVRSWCVCSGCASIPDAHAQGAHQFLTRMEVPKTSKILKNRYRIVTNKWSQKLQEKKNFLPKLIKILKIRLSIRVRNFAVPNEPLNIKKNFYFKPKVAPHRDFMV